MQGGDKICCTTCHYLNKLHRLCRKCNVRGDKSGDPLVQRKKISMVRMMQLVKDNRQDILDDFNQYNVHNAWFDVSYGGYRFWIFSAACPICWAEPGYMKYMRIRTFHDNENSKRE